MGHREQGGGSSGTLVKDALVTNTLAGCRTGSLLVDPGEDIDIESDGALPGGDFGAGGAVCVGTTELGSSPAAGAQASPAPPAVEMTGAEASLPPPATSPEVPRAGG